ncbi:hypothetical protein KUTeg_004239 [Tegillarca granosa]|uniref:Protein quiver n=1 Tax=Tegillarca granosa TaxID=220873 RepID=A0ABQ9FPH0_TEGGR|nr:hypothetical protein KUTeg_004239 [Tegillarca granosa]
MISNCLWKNIRKLRRMKGLLCVLSVLVVVLIYSETCAAISCVQCKSHKFQDCDDEFKKNDHTSKYYKPCEGPYANATACRKIVQEVYIINDWENKKGDWQRRVIRQCANHVGKMECIDRTGTYRVKTKYCHCDTENCNGSASKNCDTKLNGDSLNSMQAAWLSVKMRMYLVFLILPRNTKEKLCSIRQIIGSLCLFTWQLPKAIQNYCPKYGIQSHVLSNSMFVHLRSISLQLRRYLYSHLISTMVTFNMFMMFNNSMMSLEFLSTQTKTNNRNSLNSALYEHLITWIYCRAWLITKGNNSCKYHLGRIQIFKSVVQLEHIAACSKSHDQQTLELGLLAFNQLIFIKLKNDMVQGLTRASNKK